MSVAAAFFRVRSGSQMLWLCAIAADGEVFVYIPNTGFFHRNEALADDYYIDQRFTYERVEARVARELIDTGVGVLNPVVKQCQLLRYQHDLGALAPEALLPFDG